MVTCSDGDIDLAIQSLLVQFYPILLSTLLSIKRQQLSIFDVDFALLVSSSPLIIYLSFASVCDLCGFRTGLFKRLKYYPKIVRILGAFVPFLWNVLSMIQSFSNDAFLDSPCHPTSTFMSWVGGSISTLLSVGKGSPPMVGLFSLSPFFLLLARRLPQVRAEVRLSSDGATRLRVFFTWVKCAWYVPNPTGPDRLSLTPGRCTIDRRHKWSIYLPFVFIDLMWSGSIITVAIATNRETYVLSYGQVWFHPRYLPPDAY